MFKEGCFYVMHYGTFGVQMMLYYMSVLNAWICDRIASKTIWYACIFTYAGFIKVFRWRAHVLPRLSEHCTVDKEGYEFIMACWEETLDNVDNKNIRSWLRAKV